MGWGEQKRIDFVAIGDMSVNLRFDLPKFDFLPLDGGEIKEGVIFDECTGTPILAFPRRGGRNL